ncbi:MAG TPA: cyclic-di-AMP receptor [Anaerolineaceae bacterium]|nr:cyclic-di-AMP receptor [Anaerolineaceae bacterium]
MKMIIAIVNDEDSERVTHALTHAEYRVTTIASTGGFLRRGLTTLLCVFEDEKLTDALAVMRECFPKTNDESQKRCRIFVLNVVETHHF